MVGTVREVSFESDLALLRESPLVAPAVQMRIRHQRRVDPAGPWPRLLAGDRSTRSQVVALYDLSAVKGSKPVVVVEVDRLTNLDGLEQGAVVMVWGWPVVGRAVILDVGGVAIEATYPCTSPVFRPMRFK